MLQVTDGGEKFSELFSYKSGELVGACEPIGTEISDEEGQCSRTEVATLLLRISLLPRSIAHRAARFPINLAGWESMDKVWLHYSFTLNFLH